MDKTHTKVAGQCQYLYRAVDRTGATIDFLLRAHRDFAAARRFFEQAIELHGVKSSHSASILLAGIETMRMIKKGQLGRPEAHVSTAASQFYSLAT